MTVGRFTIRSRLGVGGMGEVYLAEDTKLKRPVALKRMSPLLKTDEHYRHRFIKEAERASSLNDQHIAGVYDVLEDRDETFVVMEYVEGITLRQRLKEPLTWKELLPIIAECAEALVAAHERGIAHHDIKPENIMLTPKGGVKILDFGVARRLPRPDQPTDSVPTDPHQISGTVGYMAPEVLLGRESDERADLFSVGVVFYEALAGKHPFLAETFIATSDRILNASPTPLRELKPEIPEPLELIVDHLLAKDPAARYASAAELVTDLRTLERGEIPKPRQAVVRTERLARRKILFAALGAVLATMLLVAILQHFGNVPPIPQKKYLAVLPFTSLSDDPAAAALSSGLAETVTARLGHVADLHGLDVVPAAEVREEHVHTLEEARKEFGVNLALAGSFQRADGQMRVTYAIVDAKTHRQLRAGTVTTSSADVFAVEDQVVEGILDNLNIALQPQEMATAQTRGTTQAAAYDYYLQGRGYLQDYQKQENVDRAITAFDHALKIDPSDALAQASLGEAYWAKYDLNKDPELVDKGLEACSDALKSNPSLAEPHLCMATLLNGTGKYERATDEFKEALAIEPNRDDTYRGLASAYEGMGELKKAEATYRRAIDLRPEHFADYNALGLFYLTHSRYADASEMFNKVVDIVPGNFAGYSNLCWADLMQGLLAETVGACQRSIAIRPIAANYSNLATAYYFQRQFSKAAETYKQALGLNEREYIVWGNLGDAYSWIPGKEASAKEAYRHAITLSEEQLKINPRNARTLGYLAWYQVQTGEKQAALETARRAVRLAPDDSELLFNVALIHSRLGDSRQTLAWLEKSTAAGFSRTFIRDTPNFDSIRSNPRFERLLEKNR